jgi:acyl carrier protein
VLPALKDRPAHYWFTDVSDVFLSRAAQKFSQYPFVSYRLYDVERTPEAQGLTSHSFDVVIAANVLHATPDLRMTLDQVRSLLTSNGVLVLFEATRAQHWFDMTTGLIEGWQKFADGLRVDSPLLPPNTWSDLLRTAGFEDVEILPQAGSPAEILGQHVILARGPAGVGESVGRESDAGDAAEFGPGSEAATQALEGAAFRREWDDAPPAERLDLLAEHVRSIVARVLRLDSPAAVDRQGRLMDLGVDSLMALELRNLLTRSLGLERSLPATLIFDYPTVNAVAAHLAETVLAGPADEGQRTPEPQPTGEADTSTADLEALSDAEVETMLLAKLKSLKD